MGTQKPGFFLYPTDNSNIPNRNPVSWFNAGTQKPGFFLYPTDNSNIPNRNPVSWFNCGDSETGFLFVSHSRGEWPFAPTYPE
ncbi:hypothetical protein [Planktothricoides raciborskii]|uniref:Uncharacterized protein n=1 Tax=Planktothricoides raciborskii FACHB-1370 TaxID=2949576 RepID=A0ABR8EC95_9CYAN|nr:hypothetical protein [Planktothricoides raciborskii]MBD2544383.1 hypothetical protein [Planktothricoides raciborskii FACHB-1370]MBD2582230.1 hypothetical protein [Planktothricoides raciborskii FACHB-1261]